MNQKSLAGGDTFDYEMNSDPNKVTWKIYRPHKGTVGVIGGNTYGDTISASYAIEGNHLMLQTSKIISPHPEDVGIAKEAIKILPEGPISPEALKRVLKTDSPLINITPQTRSAGAKGDSDEFEYLDEPQFYWRLLEKDGKLIFNYTEGDFLYARAEYSPNKEGLYELTKRAHSDDRGLVIDFVPGGPITREELIETMEGNWGAQV